MPIEALRDDGVIVGRGMERLRFQPFGIAGGMPGAVLKAIYNLGRPDERELGKIHELKLSKGDTFTVLMPGGGGYGDPFNRDPALVLADVENGFVSLERARKDYGVVIKGGAVDEGGTRSERSLRERSSHNAPFDFGPDRDA
jgi:N-methylhydantoinase B